MLTDHVEPHDRRARTAISDGQAVCRRHDRRRSARVPYAWELRHLAKRLARYLPDGVSGTVAWPNPIA